MEYERHKLREWLAEGIGMQLVPANRRNRRKLEARERQGKKAVSKEPTADNENIRENMK